MGDMHQTTFPPNIVNSIGAALDAGGETVFLQRLFGALQKRMRSDFHRFTFVVHHWSYHEKKGAHIELLPGDAAKVLIVLADEREVFPTENFSSYRAVFRAYGDPPCDSSRIFPFPIGYLNAAGSTDSKSFDQRSRCLFFSGYLNRNRIDIYKQFRPIPWLPKRNLIGRYPRELARRLVEKLCPEKSFDDAFPASSVSFTEWFGKGLEPAVYARTLADTKIALCPPGFISSETIRHWEAMRLGCVVISAPLPPNRFYKGSPIIQLQDWSELKPLLKDLLLAPEELQLRHKATVDWWERKCSEDAVADYMASVMESSTS
jgi:hypothetical protein